MNRRFTKPWLALVAVCACVLPSLLFAQSKPLSPFEIASRLYEQGKYTEAERSFRAVLGQPLDSATRGKATFNLGLTLQKLGRHDEAIKIFEHLLTQPVNDREPGAHLMEPYRNYRPRAQWEIANCLFAKQDYKGAMQAYRTTKEKFPFQSWCGNEKAEYEYRYEFYEGLCLDHLGQTIDALKHYYRAAFNTRMFYSEPEVHFRFVGIYDEAGQSDKLGKLLDSIDADLLARFKKQAAEENLKVDEESLRKVRPTGMMRRILELQSFAQQARRSELIKLLKIQSQVTGPPDDNGNWEAIEASRLLALTPKESVPELLAAAERTPDPDVRWVAYALGRCGGSEALAWLKERASKEENSWALASYCYALTQAGAPGRAIVDRLDLRGLRRESVSGPVPEAQSLRSRFPKSENVRLPDNLAELQLAATP